MVFSSPLFLFIFLPAAIVLCTLVGKNLRNAALFVVSLIFYAWGEPIYVVLMLFSTAVDYANGLMIERCRLENKPQRARFFLILSIIINLTMLGVFKYSGFIVENINSLFALSIPVPDLRLPIGISFYTFQTMSYSIDLYRGEARPQKNVIDFGAYVAMFPQLIAGPIVRYQTVAAELNSRKVGFDNFAYGIKRFVSGLAKKVLIANNVALLFANMPTGDGASVLYTWLGVIGYTFQIYFDFSGYSDMAIGLGHMLGFTFPENFNYPYISKSITEFWRRWHISLGTWFREYVYIPLGGSRRSMPRRLLNIAVVWLLTGLWHGASWNFVAWGAYYCVLLILEKTFLLKLLDKLPAFIRHIYTLIAVIFGWVLFAYDDISQAFECVQNMFGANGIPFSDGAAIYALLTNIPLLILATTASTPLWSKLYKKADAALGTKSLAVADVLLILIAMVLCTAYLVSGTYNPFLYFRF